MLRLDSDLVPAPSRLGGSTQDHKQRAQLTRFQATQRPAHETTFLPSAIAGTDKLDATWQFIGYLHVGKWDRTEIADCDMIGNRAVNQAARGAADADFQFR